MKRILFVCVENSCRSQMAEGLARFLLKDLPNYQEIKDEVKIYSSGSNPSRVVNPKAIASMAELGYDLNTHQSKSLDEIPNIANEPYEYAITMGCGDECPMIPAKHRLDWEIPDPKHMEPKDFNRIRDIIAEKVRDLLQQL